MLWRDQPGGYLKEILTARVYDVAVRCPAQLAILLPCTPVVACDSLYSCTVSASLHQACAYKQHETPWHVQDLSVT